MKVDNRDYLEERERAITTLQKNVQRMRDRLDFEAERNISINDLSVAILAAYTPAQLALLQLMQSKNEYIASLPLEPYQKMDEKREEVNHE